MSRPIPMFSATKVNTIEGYVQYSNVKAFLQSKLESSPLDEFQLIERMGYAQRKFQKFRTHQHGWHALDRPVPKAYLAAIDVTVDELMLILEKDQAEFDEVIQLPFFADNAAIRYMAAAYGNLEFPRMPEADAIKLVKNYSISNSNRKCCIVFNGIKSIHIEGKEVSDSYYYHPTVQEDKSFLTFNTGMRSVGRASLK